MGLFRKRTSTPYTRYPQNRYPQNTPNNIRKRSSEMATTNTQATAESTSLPLKDYGPNPFAISIDKATKENQNFRLALWTGPYLQVTLMSIPPGGEIGLETHPNVDQFLRLEAGEGLVMMGKTKDNLDFKQRVTDGDAFIIPSNTWHNLINIGNTPIKLYSIYSPPNHPFGTIHPTKADADAAESN